MSSSSSRPDDKTMSSHLDESGDGKETGGQTLDRLSASVNARFDAVDAALIEQRRYTEFVFNRLDGRFDRLERKLDQFIDVQSRTNALVERRLTALERRSAQE